MATGASPYPPDVETAHESLIVTRWNLAGRLRVCAHPGFTAAVAALVLNDRLLKWAVPGWWTGKLSDFAGVFVVATLVGVVVTPRLGALLVAAGFAAMKLSGWIAVQAAPLLGGQTLQDHSDLIALVAVVPAYRLARRFNSTAERSWIRVALGIVSLSVALIAVTGTSCAIDPAVDGFVVEPDRVWAHMDRSRSYPEQPEWALSLDGGRTWAETPAPASAATALSEACAGERCWRVRPPVVEERVRSDVWRPVFTFSGRQLKAMDARDSGCDTRSELRFGAVAVVGRPDGPHVVVGMGSQGVLVRSPAGDWERRPVLDLRPLRTSGSPQLWLGLQLAALLALVTTTIGLTVWAVRRPAGLRGQAAAIAAVGTMGVIVLAGGMAFAAIDFTVAGFVITGAAVLVFAASLAVASCSPRPRSVPPAGPAPPPGSGSWPPPTRPA